MAFLALLEHWFLMLGKKKRKEYMKGIFYVHPLEKWNTVD